MESPHTISLPAPAIGTDDAQNDERSCEPNQLADHPLWRQSVDFMNREERIDLAYKRAQLVTRSYRKLRNFYMSVYSSDLYTKV